MNDSNRLNKLITELKSVAMADPEKWKEKARQTYPLLIGLAESGGAAGCETDDLRVVVRINLKRNILYDLYEDWEEKRNALIDAIVEAINANRESRIWLQMLVDALPGADAGKIVERLWVRQINQNLFPALEAEAAFFPTGDLMQWYTAMLDRSDYQEERIYNRLAYFYLWYGTYACDRARARNYFLAMERRGITKENPYEGTFGAHGHDEMIRLLLEGKLDGEYFRLLTEYAKKQLAHVQAHGVSGRVEGSKYDVGNVWDAWFEDPACRDLRETMQRIYDAMMADPPEQERSLFDDLLMTYSTVLRHLMAAAKTGEGHESQAEQSALSKGVVFLLALLFNFDNWLLRLIDLESCGGVRLSRQADSEDAEPEGSTEAQFFAAVARWLEAIEPFCGKDFRIGEELLVLNSLQENLISYYDKQDDKQNMKPLLARQVYGADALTVLPRSGVDVSPANFGQPFCTHNAMALLKLYTDDGEEAKARQLVRDIAETEERLGGRPWSEGAEDELMWLKWKYTSLLEGKSKPEGWDDEQDDEQDDDSQTEPDKSKGFTCVSSASGFNIAFKRTHAEMEALEKTYRPAPPRLRGDFIRYIYDHPAGTDWFGLTEKDRERLLSSMESSMEEDETQTAE